MPLPNNCRDTDNPYVSPQADSQSLPLAISQEHVPQKFNWRLTARAWMIFFGGLPVTFAIVYMIRDVQGLQGKKPSQVVGVALFSMHIVLATISLLMLCLSTNSIQQLWKRCLIVLMQAVVAVVLYTLFCIICAGFFGLIVQ